MSSFSSSYKNKTNEKEDNSYYTFLSGILLLIIIHYFIKIYKKIFYKVLFDDENKYINCQCSKCKERYKNYKLKIKSQNINKTLIFNIFIFVIFIFLFIGCTEKVKNSNNKRFDPFEILEISESASLSEIKKAYKKLSLKYHPDKNINNKTAKEKFMNINKAYRALTNEKAKENFRKYGNPDGPGLLQYGFALPFFLFQGKAGYYILIIFSILMTIIFPILFIRWFKKSKAYNSDDLLMDNLPFFYNILNKDIQITHLPFIIGMAKEFNEMDIMFDEAEIKKIYKIFVPYFPLGVNVKKISFKNILAITMLYVHYSGSSVIIDDKQFNTQFNENKEKILEKSRFLIDQLIKIIFELNRTFAFNKRLEEFKKEKTKKIDNDELSTIEKFEIFEIKDFDFELIKIFLAFRARLFHETNIKTKNDELLQFPDNKNNLETFEKNNYTSIIETVYSIPKQNNKLKFLPNYKDIEEVLKIMPKYNIKVELSNNVFGGAGNLLTFNIKIVRGGGEQKELGFLHSNNYYDNYTEEEIIIIIDKDTKRINDYERIKFKLLNEEKQLEYSMFVENEGKNNFEVYLISLSYPGIILCQDSSIEVKEKNELIDNFIKNRFREVLTKEEFEENYGLLNDIGNDEDEEENENSHEHQN